MTAEEIRATRGGTGTMNEGHFIMLREIAAQLAEHNQSQREYIELMRPFWEKAAKE
jgi:hypothetical protein